MAFGHATGKSREPATDRSADSLVREFLGLDSRGHGCPRSDRQFMESFHDSRIAHWDHEPNRSRSRPRPRPRNQVGRSRTSSRTRTRTKGQFMERTEPMDSADYGHAP